MTINLYEKDFAEWLSSQKAALKKNNWEAVDV
ncbi:MAG: DUF29 family protein, partial [Snowella sp.]